MSKRAFNRAYFIKIDGNMNVNGHMIELKLRVTQERQDRGKRKWALGLNGLHADIMLQTFCLQVISRVDCS